MSTEAKTRWEALRDLMLVTHDDIAQGKMMSAEALTYKGKVFAFFSSKGGGLGLGCRIGRDRDPASFGLTDWAHLAPFKTRPPMKDWIVIGVGDEALWPEVALFCLDEARRLAGKA